MDTKQYAVIGHPIGHSLSPFIHSELFKLDGIKATYVALDVQDLSADFDTKLKVLDGYNVTIPYKQDIISKLHKISEKAKLSNSVNTVKNGGITEGYTTDGFGFVSAVSAKCNGTIPKDILIFGCGGAARAICFECLLNGCSISFAVRKDDLGTGNELALEIKEKLDINCDVYTTDEIPEDKHFSLLVNATPVGMYPNIDACIASDDIVQKCDAVFDAVYNPLETVLLRKAKEMGKNAIGSIDMLVYQAAKAHEIWVGAKYNDSDLQAICEMTKDKLR